MQVDIINSKGEKTGRSIELPEDIFNIEPNDHCIYLAVKQYLAAQRFGNHKTKTRAEVHGSSKKLHRQKGTGGSRKGNIRNPLYKGGGTVNGPLPHGYGFKLNRKVKDLAKISVLTHKARSGSVVVMEDITLDKPNTKTFMGMMKAVNNTVRKPMFITADANTNLHLSLRNVKGAKATILSDMNTYDLVNSDLLVFTESAAKFFTTEEEKAEA